MLSADIGQNLERIDRELASSDDLIILRLSVEGVSVAAVLFDGMVSNQQLSQLLLIPLTELRCDKNSVYSSIMENIQSSGDRAELYTVDEVYARAMSGFAVILVDGTPSAIAYGLQGFGRRGVSEAKNEQTLHGPKESFTETLNTSIAQMRRKLKTAKLHIEGLVIGKQSNTQVKLLYIDGRVSYEMLEQVKKRLKGLNIDALLDSAYLSGALTKDKLSLFSPVGRTERPDVLASKLCEGRIGILVDGTPFALIVPYLFMENIQSPDDYVNRPYYSWLMRILRLFGFYTTVFLPGLFVAIITFHPELLPSVIIENVLLSAASTPLSPMAEALMLILLYELLREAGLRLPEPVGNSISVVGGLVIGDAAVTAGLIGLPMLIVIGITAIASFVVQRLYQSVLALRLIFVVLGGLFGVAGIAVGGVLLAVNLCSVSCFGVPYMAPVAPLKRRYLSDLIFRLGDSNGSGEGFTVGKLKEDKR